MKVMALASVKGGVGKTTAAVNLAHLAAVSGRRVLLWDLDPQGAATHVLRIGRRAPGGARRLVEKRRAIAGAIVESAHPGLDVVPADFSLRHLDLDLDRLGRARRRVARSLETVAADYDLAVVDCPPGISLTVEAVLRATDVLLVPVVPTDLPRRGYEMLTSYVAAERKLRGTIMLGFVSMLDGRRPGQRKVADEIRADTEHFLATAIPLSIAAERMIGTREPITESEPRSPAATAYRRLWDEIAGRLPEAADAASPT